MNLLAIDSATEKLSIAIAVNSTAAASDTWLFEADAGLRHSELAMDIIDILMQKAALKPEDLSGVVCMGGPGSFTGLRIGFSLAKGLALSLDLPFAAIPTLDAIAWPFASWPGIIVPVIDAKKSAFFCAAYRSGKRLIPDMDASPAEIARSISGTLQAEPASQILLTGPGAELLYEQLSGLIPGVMLGKKLRYGNAATLLEIAAETNVWAKNTNNHSSGPEYIRKSDAELMRQEHP